MSEEDIDKIEPVDFDLNDSPLFSNQTAQVTTNKTPIWMWVGLGSLLLVALLVIFVLPAVVSQYELPLERRLEVADLQPAQVAANPASAISPFEEAQRSLQRKEAQDVIAEVMERQGELVSLEVEKWGQVPYEEALDQSSIGDEYYRTQDFTLARDNYAQGRDQLIALIETIPTVFTQIMIDAQKALDEPDSLTAQDKFSLALVFEPDNETAQIGLERARSLDEVAGLIAQAL